MDRKCIGIWGLLLGHRFVFGSWTSDRIVNVDHCQRCGMPKGGWRS